MCKAWLVRCTTFRLRDGFPTSITFRSLFNLVSVLSSNGRLSMFVMPLLSSIHSLRRGSKHSSKIPNLPFLLIFLDLSLRYPFFQKDDFVLYEISHTSPLSTTAPGTILHVSIFPILRIPVSVLLPHLMWNNIVHLSVGARPTVMILSSVIVSPVTTYLYAVSPRSLMNSSRGSPSSSYRYSTSYGSHSSAALTPSSPPAKA